MQVSNRLMIFYTRQSPKVFETLKNNGIYTVDESYIVWKYTTISEHYASLYRHLTLLAGDYIDIPDGLLYPIWLSPEGTELLPDADETVFLKLDIPEGKYILANNEVWDFMINHLYFPKDKEDELAHEAEIARYGISSPSSLISGDIGNFYPLLKQKVIKSWDRVFSMMPPDPSNIVGLCWELRSEWLLEAK